MPITIYPKRWGFKPPLGAQLQTGHPLSIGLGESWIYNELGGTRVYGLRGSALPITSASWAATSFGSALQFSGAGYVGDSSSTTNSPVSVCFVNPLTVETWVYPTISNAYQTLVSLKGVPRQYSYFLSGNGTSKIYVDCVNNSIGDISVSPNWAVNAWNHIVMAIDAGSSGNITIYINGVQAGSAAMLSSVGSASPTILYVGSEQGSNPTTGYIGKTSIWSRRLLSAEIFALYRDPYCFMQPQAPQDRYWANLGTLYQQSLFAHLNDFNMQALA